MKNLVFVFLFLFVLVFQNYSGSVSFSSKTFIDNISKPSVLQAVLFIEDDEDQSFEIDCSLSWRSASAHTFSHAYGFLLTNFYSLFQTFSAYFNYVPIYLSIRNLRV